MDVADLPENGLAFLACKSGEIILRAGVKAHFDLIPLAAETDDWPSIERWLSRQRPRLGRIGRRGGQPALLTFTKPLGRPVPASEDEQQELDHAIRDEVLVRVVDELKNV
jgi:hypothetical protein